MKSDVLNCQHSMIDLMTNSYAQKAALWSLYGKSEMSILSSQLLLHLNTSNPTQGVQSYNGEGTCQALCNVVNILTEEVIPIKLMSMLLIFLIGFKNVIHQNNIFSCIFLSLVNFSEYTCKLSLWAFNVHTYSISLET